MLYLRVKVMYAENKYNAFFFFFLDNLKYLRDLNHILTRDKANLMKVKQIIISNTAFN